MGVLSEKNMKKKICMELVPFALSIAYKHGKSLETVCDLGSAVKCIGSKCAHWNFLTRLDEEDPNFEEAYRKSMESHGISPTEFFFGYCGKSTPVEHIGDFTT